MAQRRRRKKIGEILLAQGLITQEVLDKAMDEHRSSGEPLGKVLVNQGYIDLDTLQGILGLQMELSGQRKRLGEILIDRGLIDQEKLGLALEEQKRQGGQ